MRSFGGIFNKAKHNAKRRELEWLITFEQFLELRKLPCHYCGGSLPETGHGLDRRDNSAGYLIENVVPCCTTCNSKKGSDWSVEETRVAVQAVIKLRGRRNA